jgi:hypothetical protein
MNITLIMIELYCIFVLCCFMVVCRASCYRLHCFAPNILSLQWPGPMFDLYAVLSNPTNLRKHQVNQKVIPSDPRWLRMSMADPIINKMMAKVNGRSQCTSWAHHKAIVVTVTCGLVVLLSGELLVYPFGCFLPCGPLRRGITMLWPSRWWPSRVHWYSAGYIFIFLMIPVLSIYI